MGNEWRDATLGDLISIQRGHDLTETERRPGDVPVFGSAGQNGFHDKALAPAPGVVIGRSGASFGQVSYCAVPYWPHNTTLYVTDFRGNAPRFVYYCLKATDFSRYNSGSAQQSLNRNYIYSAPLRIPKPNTQRAIAHILGTLDDKIEVIRKMAATLEAMAWALFKSWFVDFEPVRAKTEGRDPGLPPHIATVFPDRLTDTEEGEVPEGWSIGSIYEVASVIYGAPFSSAQFNGDAIGEPLIRIRDLTSESPGVWTPEVHPKGYKVRAGDIVVGMDGEFRAYLWGGAEAWLNQRVCVFKPRPLWSAAFVRNAIIQPLAQVEATEAATTVIHLGKADIDLFRVVLPRPDVVDYFNRTCQPWYDRIVAIKQETRTLAALRDNLLPKLISGDLRVADAKRFLAERNL